MELSHALDFTSHRRTAAGYPRAAFVAPGPAARAPLLLGALGAAWDAERRRLVITQSGATSLRVLDAPSDDPSTWVDRPAVEVGETGLAGIARDPADDSFVVVDEDNHCVRRLSADLVLDDEPVLGTCGTAGALLDAPSQLAFASTGTLYVADTGHHRVVRFDATREPHVSVVVGNGEPASAGEGSPAAEQALNAPRQLAFDAYDNLYVTSTTTVRVVVNDDGDDPDGDDHVVTAFGAGNGIYPERDVKCLTALAPLPTGLVAPDDARASVVVGDACLGTASLLYVRSAP
jgi:hypothetical protein